MRRWLVLFVFLAGAVSSSAQLREERVSPLIQAMQEDSLVGLGSVHLRTLAWTHQVSPEDLHSILRRKISIGSAAEGVEAETPFLRLTYDLNERTLENGQSVSVYWVSLELVQAVAWTWTTVNGPSQSSDGGLAVTWSAMRADVAADPAAAAVGLKEQVASLGAQLAADVVRMNPVWDGYGMSMDPDGHISCKQMSWTAERRPRTEFP